MSRKEMPTRKQLYGDNRAFITISEKKYEELLKTFTIEEIKEVLDEMLPHACEDGPMFRLKKAIYKKLTSKFGKKEEL